MLPHLPRRRTLHPLARFAPFWMLLAITLPGCTLAPDRELAYHASRDKRFQDDLPKALDEAESRWAMAGITNYTFYIRRGGAFGGSVYQVIFRNGACRAIHIKDIGLPSSLTCEDNSIPKLFALVRSQLTNDNDDVRLNFDARSGYLRGLSMEPHTDLTDQEWFVEISRFKSLK